jgi:ATP-dependent RNA helicase DDX60
MTIRNVLEQLLVKASAEASQMDPGVDEDVDIDSGYGTFDPAENDVDEGREANEEGFKRPRGVGDLDWKVYEVVGGALREFEEKYRAMWA